MTPDELQTQIQTMTQQLDTLKQQVVDLGIQASEQMAVLASKTAPVMMSHGNFFIDALTVLILAGFVGYYVIWNVTPALHAPLMGITNAISSVIIVGALIAVGPAESGLPQLLGFFAIVLASVNIFGGFVVTNRMLSMFKGKKKAKEVH
jgi:H+-translocating NAD(P) transhydrogenase subunit alpha